LTLLVPFHVKKSILIFNFHGLDYPDALRLAEFVLVTAAVGASFSTAPPYVVSGRAIAIIALHEEANRVKAPLQVPIVEKGEYQYCNTKLSAAVSSRLKGKGSDVAVALRSLLSFLQTESE